MTRQRGVALLTALLVVALGVLLAAEAFREVGLDVRRAQTMAVLEQGYQYARGLEAWAIAILADDYEQGGPVDHSQEPWNFGLPVIDVPGGRLTGRLADLDGRFNVNNLVLGEQRQETQIAIFRRLLTSLGLNPEIAASVVDWQDANTFSEQRGAEDPAYLRADPPYRAANRDFAHVSELRLVAGIDAESYALLEPYVIALPVFDQPTPVNVNSAPPELLAALHGAITPRVAENLYREGNARYESIEEFLQAPALREINVVGLEGLVAVQSRYFLAHGVVELGDVRQNYYAVLERNGGQARTIFHARGVY